MLKGRIIKTTSEFYYVDTKNGLFTCKARGIFKKDKIKPLVGDFVEIDELKDKDINGNVIRILPRKNELKRPTVANIDIAVLVFAFTNPEPKFSIIDKNLIKLNDSGIDTILCFNKSDLVSDVEIDAVKDIYKNSDVEIIFTSTVINEGLEKLKLRLKGRTVLFTGASGVGKSSIINAIAGKHMETGELSKKTLRGKQTTRHYEMVLFDKDTYLLDSPGFTAINFDIDYYFLKEYYNDFLKFGSKCKYGNKCLHLSEPDCEIKKMVEKREINKIRYESYLEILNELKNQRKG